MINNELLKVDLFEDNNYIDPDYDLDQLIFDLESEIDLLSSHADNLDYLVAIGSGLTSAMLDILWVGDFDLAKARDISSDKIDDFVVKIAEMDSKKEQSLESAVRYLEGKYNIPSDGNTNQFGGALQHHLRDFAHHPTIIGLMFSLLTQFTHKAYGTSTTGKFIILDIPDRKKHLIGKDVPEKITFATIHWFFHLVSDMAGSINTVGKSGGTGIPGPILSLAKELSVLPFFKKNNVGDHKLSVFLSKLFNGTLLADHDESGKIIKDSVLRFDLRAELGVLSELSKQAVPVIANECIVRSFYFIRHFGYELKTNNIDSISNLKDINWENVKPYDNPTITRMLTIATGVFTTVDITEAITSKKIFIAINYVGIGRFVVAINQDVGYHLKSRNIKNIQKMYKDIDKNTFRKIDSNLYERIQEDMNTDKLGLTLEQTEILYNLEYYKTLNDIDNTNVIGIKDEIKILKKAWLDEWQEYISKGFESFLQIKDAKINWYSESDLIKKVEENNPYDPWFRLTILEAMLFEPYYPLGLEKNRKGVEIPSKKYNKLENQLLGYSRRSGDKFINDFFNKEYYPDDYVDRLRKTYNKVLRELNEVLKGILTTVTIGAVITVVTVATAGIFSGYIAVALVGSNFAGLSGAALTNAALAYLGGGAIAAGGAGMIGGAATIVGGGAFLGAGVGLGIGGAVGKASIIGKENTILQSAKLLVSIREIFLNDEHDLTYSNSVYEQYLENITNIEKGLVELKLKYDVSSGQEKKELKEKIKRAEDSVEAMKIARKNLNKFISSFEEGLNVEVEK